MTPEQLATWLRDWIAQGDGWSIQIEAADAPALAEILDRADRLPKRPRKSHCKHGHLMAGANAYRQPKTGANRCRACWRERARRAYQKKKSEQK